MGKLEQNKKQKRETLLQALFALFTEKGFEHTTISDIASRAGVAKGTFYLYFKDKYDLRSHLILYKSNELFTEAYRKMERAGVTEFEEKVIFIVDSILDRLSKDKPLMRFIHKDLSWALFREALNVSDPEEKEPVIEIFRKMMEEEGERFDDPELMLYLIIELVSASVYTPIIHGQPVTLAELKPHLYRTIRGIIREHSVG